VKRHPTQGVKGAKPRLKKLPSPPDSHTDGELSREYLIERNAAMRAKRLTAEMTLAQQRGQLIEKELAIRQASFLLIGLRQKALRIPYQLRAKFGPKVITKEIFDCATHLVHQALHEMADLPKVVEPDWLETLEEEE
jgi:phage terminase Nu1 subunit (DNA packaging protein)